MLNNVHSEQCHTNSGELARIVKNEKNKLVQCPCRFDNNIRLPQKVNGSCPLGQKHPPHGEEYCLGCQKCRN